MISKGETQLRATFKDTKKNQEKLRLKLDELDLNNKFIIPDERGTFFELLSDSLLGFDYDKKTKIRLPDDNYIHIDNVGEFIRRLSYYTSDKVDYDFFKYYNLHCKNIDIGSIWHELKFFVFGIYPEAIAMSVRISKEQTHLGPSEAGKV